MAGAGCRRSAVADNCWRSSTIAPRNRVPDGLRRLSRKLRPRRRSEHVVASFSAARAKGTRAKARDYVLDLSEIRRQSCAVAVPLFHGSIFGFEETERTTVGAVSEKMAAYLAVIPWFDVFLRDADVFEAGATGGLQSPNLRLTLGILNFQVDPGVGNHKVDLFNNTLQIYKCVRSVVAV